ncbi:unknown [Clostridium sp. CAG:1024]|nr:unknown [Clostridium sp. CAG:1024]
MGQGDVHAEAGEQADDALRDGQRLAVARAVGPGHGDLLALQVLDAAHLMDDVERIRHALRGMVDVALEIHERGLLLEHAVLVALRHGVDDLMHVGVALADVHIVADTDRVRHEGDHVCGLADGLAVRDLALALVKILNFQTQQVAGGCEREARAGAVVAEQRDAEAGVKDLRGYVVLAQMAQRVRNGEHRFDLILRFFPGQEKVAFVHVRIVQLFEFVGKLLDIGFFAHEFSPIVFKGLE